ncbi:hypothetical protein BKA57DRAFT_42205 [Linnemannia elongata]|nr:hypothetical protein BKA57DRAFT_42205 [Linnemannia elongata]
MVARRSIDGLLLRPSKEGVAVVNAQQPVVLFEPHPTANEGSTRWSEPSYGSHRSLLHHLVSRQMPLTGSVATQRRVLFSERDGEREGMRDRHLSCLIWMSVSFFSFLQFVSFYLLPQILLFHPQPSANLSFLHTYTHSSHFQHNTLSCVPRPFPSQSFQRQTPSTIVHTNRYSPL